MYTNTPDLKFILDHHLLYPNVTIGSACSSHGFKFSVVIGEILSDLAVEGSSQLDLDKFKINRFD
jgi:sarcosine oxidase|tara:strand:+ start:675 stop:869 length:195 start_codon:yes stop_codon:yes gene_type:complete